MKRNIAIFALVVMLCTIMTGCGHTHVWTEATCTAPKTCSECDATEGEAIAHNWSEATCTAPKTCSMCGATEAETLEHSWNEATCAAPKTCSMCGATEGETLEHSWSEATCAVPKTCSQCGMTEGEALEHTLTEATYQSAAICTVCETAVGEPLTPVFEEYGFTFSSADADHAYVGSCWDDPSIALNGTVRMENYHVVPSDANHSAKEGYEWHIADFRCTLSGAEIARLGYLAGINMMDYYSGIELADKEDNVFTINSYHGEPLNCAMEASVLENAVNGDSAVVTFRIAVQVPIDYDGFVVYVFNPGVTDGYTEDKLTEASAVFFRLDQ